MATVVPLQVFSFLALILHIPVLVWYVKIKNIPASCLATWFLILSLNNFIATTIWISPNLENWWNGIIFCDIMVRVLAGCNTGILCATTAVARNLAIIMSNDGPKLGFNSFRSRMVDLTICLALPLVLMILVYIVQQRRYLIYQFQGCTLQVAPTWATFAVIIIWPPILSLITSVYVVLTVCRYLVKRRDAKDVLHCSGSGMTIAKFIRFFAFCVIIIGVVVPLSIYHMVVNIESIRYYNVSFNWKQFHSEAWSTINTFAMPGPSTDQYVNCVLAYVSLVCFGTGKDIGLWFMRGLDFMRIGWIFKGIGEYCRQLGRNIFKEDSNGENRNSFNSSEMAGKVFFSQRAQRSPESGRWKNDSSKSDTSYFTEGGVYGDGYSIDLELDSIPVSPYSMNSHSQLIRQGSYHQETTDKPRNVQIADMPVPVIRGVPFKSKEWNSWNHGFNFHSGGSGSAESSSRRYASSSHIDNPSSNRPSVHITETYRMSSYNDKDKNNVIV